MDWDDLRFFQALLRHKTLSATAQHLHVTQSTVGRRLASLEASLGVRLVHRTHEGYVPTAAGEAIREHIDRVEAETQAVRRVVGVNGGDIWGRRGGGKLEHDVGGAPPARIGVTRP
jgi:DNA-binding transcriptional LysR family regulator